MPASWQTRTTFAHSSTEPGRTTSAAAPLYSRRSSRSSGAASAGATMPRGPTMLAMRSSAAAIESSIEEIRAPRMRRRYYTD
jgi:hypothetical protein